MRTAKDFFFVNALVVLEKLIIKSSFGIAGLDQRDPTCAPSQHLMVFDRKTRCALRKLSGVRKFRIRILIIAFRIHRDENAEVRVDIAHHVG